MTVLHKLFLRVHSRYTRSPFAGELSSYSHWLIERECNLRYAQRLVFHAKRSLEASGLPPDRVWTDDELDRAFHRRRPRRGYQHSRHTFGLFLQSAGRLTPRQKLNPFEQLLAAYKGYLSEVRGLVPASIVQHVMEVDGLLRHLLPNGKPLKRLTAKNIEMHIEQRAQALSRHPSFTTSRPPFPFS